MPKFPPFYKYLEKVYARSMLERGVIKIGTLKKFREDESLDRARRDPNEGRMNVVLSVEGYQRVPADILKDYGILAPSGFANLTDLSLVKPTYSENLHIYCMSFTKGEHLFKEFDKSDTCIEILDPSMAIRAIGTQLIRQKYLPLKTRYGIFKCTYFDNSEVTHQMKKDGITPWQVKDSFFKIQDEWRFVFKTNVDTPIILEVPALVKMIRLVEF